MRYLATSLVLLFCVACGDTELPKPPLPTRSEVKPLKDQLEEIGTQIGEVENILAERLKLNPTLADQDETKNIERRLEQLKKTYSEVYKQLLRNPKQGQPLVVPGTVIVKIICPHKIRGGRILFIQYCVTIARWNI